MLRIALRVLLVVAAFFGGFQTAAEAADYYVNGDALTDGDGSQNSPWQAIHVSVMGAGDTQHIKASKKPYTSFYIQNIDGCSSAAGITFVGESGPGGQYPTVISIAKTNGQTVQIPNGSCIHIRNFSITNPIGINPNGACVLVGTDGSPATAHHIDLDHLEVHDCGGSGIGITWADYVTIQYTDSWNNGATVGNYAGSAFSNYEPTSVPGDTASGPCYGVAASIGAGFRNCFVNLRCWNTKTGVLQATDGNCVIIDDWKCLQHQDTNCNGTNYVYAGHVTGITCWDNDGPCVHVYSTNTHIKVDHITSYGDCRICGSTRGSVDSYQSQGQLEFSCMTIQALSHYPFDANGADSNTTITLTGNNLYGGTGPYHYDDSAGTFSASGNIRTVPTFVSTSLTGMSDLRQTNPPATACS